MSIVVSLDTPAEHVHLVQAEQEWMLDKYIYVKVWLMIFIHSYYELSKNKIVEEGVQLASHAARLMHGAWEKKERAWVRG